MTLAHPAWIAGLLLVPVVLLVALAAWRARAGALAQFGGIAALRVPPHVGRARAVQSIAALVVAAGLVVALAGPRLGFDWQQQKVEGVAMVVVLDVSRSMDATDAPPSRMVQARRELTDMAALLRGDTVGLVIFAAGSYVRIPPTIDYATFLWAVDTSDTSTIQAQGTSLPGAIDAATQLLSRGAAGAGRAILVVSDGEDHGTSTALDEALARAKAADVHVYALGVGTPEGAPIPMEGGGFKKDSRGDVVVTKLDEAVLQRIASETGGAYVRAVPSDADGRALVEDEIRGKLASAERGVRREKVWRERYQWPLALALGGMVLAAAMGVGRRASVGLGMVLALSLLSPRAYAGGTEDGEAAWRTGHYEDAVRWLGQARVEAPKDTKVAWMLADSLYRSGRYRDAERLYQQLAAVDPERKGRHLFNAGNAAYRGGRLDDALEDYVAAAGAEPELESAARNAEAVRKEIATRRNPPPKAPPQAEGQQEQTPPEQDGQQQGAPPEPQEGQGQAEEPQSGKTGQGSERDEGTQAPPEGADGTPPTDGTRTERTPGEVGGDAPLAGGTPAEATASEPVAPGTLTKEEATRLVESVQDGKPRVVVAGRTTEEDW